MRFTLLQLLNTKELYNSESKNVSSMSKFLSHRLSGRLALVRKEKVIGLKMTLLLYNNVYFRGPILSREHMFFSQTA